MRCACCDKAASVRAYDKDYCSECWDVVEESLHEEEFFYRDLEDMMTYCDKVQGAEDDK